MQRLAAGAITRRFPAPNYQRRRSDQGRRWWNSPRPICPGATPRNSPAWTDFARGWCWSSGQRAPATSCCARDGRVTLGLIAQSNHNALHSAQWAHVQQVAGHDPIGRIVAPPRWRLACGRRPRLFRQYRIHRLPGARIHCDGDDSWNGSSRSPAICTTGGLPHRAAGRLPRAGARSFTRPTSPPSSRRAARPFGRAEVRIEQRTTPARLTPLADRGRAEAAAFWRHPIPRMQPRPRHRRRRSRRSHSHRHPGRPRRVTAPRYDAAFTNANAVGDPAAGGWIDQLRERSAPARRGGARRLECDRLAGQIADAAAAKPATSPSRAIASVTSHSASSSADRCGAGVARRSRRTPRRAGARTGKAGDDDAARPCSTRSPAVRRTDARVVLVGRTSRAAPRSGAHRTHRRWLARHSAQCSAPPMNAPTRPDAASDSPHGRRSARRDQGAI